MSWDAISNQLDLLPDYLGNHLLLTMLALALGIFICIPLGCLVTRVKSLQWPVLSIAGILQTIPGIALLALMVPILGTIGFLPALVALTIYSFMPILRNTVTGIIGVDPAVVEAARGIGMTDMQLLFKIELPLALPVIIAGIRTATVWVVGTATLATPVGATSLGNYIFSGLQTQNLSAITVGCVSAAMLAIVLDQLTRLVEVAASKRSLRMGIAALAALIVLLVAGVSPAISSNRPDHKLGTVTIGSKPFTEQYILAELLSDIVIDAGYNSDQRSGMGSIILFEALSNSSIDCYVDYTGTIWTNVMKRQDIPSRAQILQEMTGWLDDEHGILCLGALGFENTYALAVKGELADEYNLETIADLAEVSSQFVMGSDYEFFSRPEWASLERTYDLDFKDLRTFDPSLMYGAINERNVEVISAYSTDGRIAAYNLKVLDDPSQAIPPYDAVLLLSPESSQDRNLINQLKALIGSITNSEMRHANKMVDLDKLPVDSAAEYLKSSSN
ncbi:MAG: ABC transporter permease subunit [candidate division Zixibacteria bacterium]|nr:ABC transporter permease subunit [candidate division Zixibacteria bacterium]NIR67991.1 ABC transporter permease subunit [candidate division Zixibacteria bacterium]NIS17491.1 ABC transporter permease subunit [candidate division Zixibacteria bacterium]NIS49197.1 ABC transporter permease subunit [candidate division Zixibacteria bacterium]NIT53800.1 ABC transporter permease subunit [candidate division Zixibacteria bacterium]